MAAVIAAAGVDPYDLHDSLASGDPDAIFTLARAFDAAAAEAVDSYQHARSAHSRIGTSFTNNGAAVLDVAGQDVQARRLLGDGGEHMRQTADSLKRTGLALESSTEASARALGRMEDGLESLRRSWNVFLDANGGRATAADEQKLMASAIQVVQSGGASVQAHIDDYDAMLGHGTGVLGELGHAAAPGPDEPGQPGGEKYVIGSPTRPPFTFDDDFVLDPDADASLGDHVSWNEWGLKMSGAGLLRPDLDDSLQLYAHYRDGSGTPATVDYEEGYREDASIRRGVDAEIAAARQGVEQLHRDTGRTSFSFTGDAASAGPYPETENWQKTLGAHQVWSSGDVTIDGDRATMTVTVHAEDRYNFNRGAADIASGAPDDENGRFAELGWAKSFDVSGGVTRTVSWDLGSAAPPVVTGGDPTRDLGGEDRVDGAGGGR
jgi:hypothetical protein